MTSLTTSTKTIHSVDYSDFEQAVKDYYKVDDYSFPADAESGNDVAITTGVMTKTPLADYEQEEIFDFRTTGEYCYLYRTLLQDMINNDVAPEGDYVIEVSW